MHPSELHSWPFQKLQARSIAALGHSTIHVASFPSGQLMSNVAFNAWQKTATTSRTGAVAGGEARCSRKSARLSERETRSRGLACAAWLPPNVTTCSAVEMLGSTEGSDSTMGVDKLDTASSLPRAVRTSETGCLVCCMVSVAHGFTAHCVAMMPIRLWPLEISARVSADKLNDAGTTARLESDGDATRTGVPASATEEPIARLGACVTCCS